MNLNLKKWTAVLAAGMLIITAGCEAGKTDETSMTQEETGMSAAYTRITQEEAKEMMGRDDGHIIVDVRRRDEYDAGHIPGAILIPNESIGTEKPAELPDPDQIILIYCRSGNRSKQAAQKLADMGYTHIYEFGGIITWTGEIVTKEAESSDPDTSETDQPSEPEAGSEAEKQMRLRIGETEVPVTWEDNASVEALKSLLPLTIRMSKYGGFEQVGPIGSSIVRDDKQTTTDYGDIVLYSGNQIVIFYGSNEWAYTRLGHISLSRSEMADLLSAEDVTITISMD